MVENNLRGQVFSGTGKFGVFCQLVKGSSHVGKASSSGCTVRDPKGTLKKNKREVEDFVCFVCLLVWLVGLGLTIVDFLMALFSYKISDKNPYKI